MTGAGTEVVARSTMVTGIPGLGSSPVPAGVSTVNLYTLPSMTPFGGFGAGAGTAVMLTVTEVLVSEVAASMRIWACGGVSPVKTSDVVNAVPAAKTLDTGCGADVLPRNRYGSAMQLPSKIGGE